MTTCPGVDRFSAERETESGLAAGRPGPPSLGVAALPERHERPSKRGFAPNAPDGPTAPTTPLRLLRDDDREAQRFYTGVHDGGHLAGWLELGYCELFARIEDAPRQVGGIQLAAWIGPTAEPDFSPTDVSALDGPALAWGVVISFGGPAAECVWRGMQGCPPPGPGNSGCARDLEEAYAGVREMAGRLQTPPGMIAQRMWDRAILAVETHWPTVLRFAEALSARGTLAPVDIRTIVAAG